MRGAIERVRVAAERRADVLRMRVAARIAAALPGAAVVEDGERITISGRGVIRRWVGREDLRHVREGEG